MRALLLAPQEKKEPSPLPSPGVPGEGERERGDHKPQSRPRRFARRGSASSAGVSDILVGSGGGTGGEDGRFAAFNDAGQLVYRLAFADGMAGIFVTTVPDPSAAALLLAAASSAVLVLRRRSRRAASH